MTVIDIKMSAIYGAAHDVLPTQAEAFKAKADSITGAIEPIVSEVSLAGNHPIAGDLADVATELFLHLRELVRTFNDSAVALDRIADDFVAVDEEAAAWFAQHQQYLGDPDVPSDPTAPVV